MGLGDGEPATSAAPAIGRWADWLLRLWRSFSSIGVLVGTLFFAFSLTPSLLPRGPAIQGILSVASAAAGYGLGALVAWLWAWWRLPPLAWRMGIYRNLISFSGARASGRLFYACALLSAPLTIIFGWVQVSGVPRTTSLLHPMIFFLLMLFLRLSMRFVVSDLLHMARGNGEGRRRLVI